MAPSLATYEAELKRQYVTENKTAKDTIASINRTYGTNFTERQLKAHYGRLKNVQAEEWKAVIYKILNREVEGKHYDVYINGRRQKKDRVRRAFTRYKKKLGPGRFDDVDLGINTVNEHRIEIRTTGVRNIDCGLPVELDTGYASSTTSSQTISIKSQPIRVEPERFIQDVEAAEGLGANALGSFSSTSLELASTFQMNGPGAAEPAPINSPFTSHSSLILWNESCIHPRLERQASPSIHLIDSQMSTFSNLNLLQVDGWSFWDLPDIPRIFPNLTGVTTSVVYEAPLFLNHPEYHIPPRDESNWISYFLSSVNPKLATLVNVTTRVQSLLNRQSSDCDDPLYSCEDLDPELLFQMLTLVAYLISNGEIKDLQVAEFLSWIAKEGFIHIVCKFIRTSPLLGNFILQHLLQALPNLGVTNKSSANVRSSRNLFEAYPNECCEIISAANSRMFSDDLLTLLLFKAVEANHHQAVKVLVARRKTHSGCTYQNINAYPPSPLVRAAELGLDDIVRLLINASGNIDGSKASGREISDALGMAVSHRNFQTAKILLEKAENVRLDTIIDDQPILQWTSESDAELYSIIKSKAYWTEQLQESLTSAAERGSKALLSAVRVKGALRSYELEGVLCFAIRCGRVGAVRTLLAQGVDVEAPKYHASCIATGLEFQDTLLLALSFKSNFSDYSRNKDMAYLLRRAGKKLPPVKALLQFRHPLVPSIWSILVESGFDINLVGSYALVEQAGSLSRDKGRGIAACGHLIDQGAPIDAYGPLVDKYRGFNDEQGVRWLSVLQAAAYNGNLDLALHCIERGANVNLAASENSGLTALQAAALFGNIILVESLLEEGADINAHPAKDEGYTVLEAASHVRCRNSSLAIFRTLLEMGASPNRPDGTAGQLLASLITNGHYECLKLALEAKAQLEGIAQINVGDGPIFNGTPLQVAAYFKDLNAVRELLKHGAVTNTPAHHVRGYTALQAACAMNERPNQADSQAERFKKQADIVDLLLSHGADVNAPASEQFGRTALQAVASAEEPNFVVIDKLLRQHANINDAPARIGGVTALQAAAIRGNLYLARMLLNLGADVNAAAAPAQGRTAGEGAAEYGRMEMLKLLLHNGAHAEPLTGFSVAIKLASENGHWHIIDFLNELHLGL